MGKFLDVFAVQSFYWDGGQGFRHTAYYAYNELFLWNWATYPAFIPVGCALGVASLYGFWNGIKRAHPWAIALAFYLIPHLLVGHKEGRFMVPIETLLRWAAFFGCALAIRREFLSGIQFGIPLRVRKLALGAVGALLVLNGFIFLHHLRADFWKDRGVYREVSTHLQKVHDVCGILVPFEISSILFLLGIHSSLLRLRLVIIMRPRKGFGSVHPGMEEFPGSSVKVNALQEIKF